jgi:hypothetical protein
MNYENMRKTLVFNALYNTLTINDLCFRGKNGVFSGFSTFKKNFHSLCVLEKLYYIYFRRETYGGSVK